jgi:hypothetical protein
MLKNKLSEFWSRLINIKVKIKAYFFEFKVYFFSAEHQNIGSFSLLFTLFVSCFFSLPLIIKIFLYLFSYMIIKYYITEAWIQVYIIDLITFCLGKDRLSFEEFDYIYEFWSFPPYNFYDNVYKNNPKISFWEFFTYFLKKQCYNFYSFVVAVNIIIYNYTKHFLFCYFSFIVYFIVNNYPSIYITLLIMIIIIIKKLFLVGENFFSYEYFLLNLYENNPELEGKKIKLTYRNIVLLRLWIFRRDYFHDVTYNSEVNYFLSKYNTIKKYKIPFNAYLNDSNREYYKIRLEMQEENPAFLNKHLYLIAPLVLKVKKLGLYIPEEKPTGTTMNNIKSAETFQKLKKMPKEQRVKLKQSEEKSELQKFIKSTEGVITDHAIYTHDENGYTLITHATSNYNFNHECKTPALQPYRSGQFIQAHSNKPLDAEVATVAIDSFKISNLLQPLKTLHMAEDIRTLAYANPTNLKYKSAVKFLSSFPDHLVLPVSNTHVDHNKFIAHAERLEQIDPKASNDLTRSINKLNDTRCDNVEKQIQEKYMPESQALPAKFIDSLPKSYEPLTRKAYEPAIQVLKQNKESKLHVLNNVELDPQIQKTFLDQLKNEEELIKVMEGVSNLFI